MNKIFSLTQRFHSLKRRVRRYWKDCFFQKQQGYNTKQLLEFMSHE